MARFALSTAALAATLVFSPVALANAEPADAPPPAPVIDLKLLPKAWTEPGSGGMSWSDPKKFGEAANKALDDARGQIEDRVREAIGQIVSPIAKGAYEFTSGFGARWGQTHYGIDLAAPLGTKIVAAADGTVIDSGPASGFGNWIRVQLDDGTINVYGHMASSGLLVKQGEKVAAGQDIALVGSEGFSTGPHLHFEVWTKDGQKIDPLPWLKDRGVSIG